jgi:hypothetical protein
MRVAVTTPHDQLDETIPYPGSLPAWAHSRVSSTRTAIVGSRSDRPLWRNLLDQVGQDYGFDEREIPPAFVVRDR